MAQLVGHGAFFAIGVSVAVVWLGLKYHKTHDGQIGARIEGNLPLELLWSVIPTIIAMFMFGWGASVFYHLRRPPDEALAEGRDVIQVSVRLWDGKTIAWLYRNGEVMERRDDDEYAHIKVRLAEADQARFARLTDAGKSGESRPVTH